MHVGKSYRLPEFLYWTRRRAWLAAASAIALTALYQAGECRWLALPWPVLALLGTAASFIVGFKNSQTYGRTVEALQVWSSIVAASRHWGLICRDFPSAGNPAAGDPAPELIGRHLAWLTAVRYQLRTPQVWEAASIAPNVEYRKRMFDVPEWDLPLETALAAHLPDEVVATLMASGNVPGTLMSLQSRAIKKLFVDESIVVLHYSEMQKTLKDLIDQHARAERIKNFPYPRQYAVINSLLVWLFALLLPMGMVKEFAQLDAPGIMHGHMGWLAVPFSVLIAWIYLALDQVGESTENPFEGSANDVPITHLCRGLELELWALLGVSHDLPTPTPTPAPGAHIVL
jgi:putative membrane protein